MNVNVKKETLARFFQRLADRHGLGEVIDAYYHMDALDADSEIARVAFEVIKGREEDQEARAAKQRRL